MLSIDSNILLHAFNKDSPSHKAAYAWMISIQRQDGLHACPAAASAFSLRSSANKSGSRVGLRGLLLSSRQQ